MGITINLSNLTNTPDTRRNRRPMAQFIFSIVPNRACSALFLVSLDKPDRERRIMLVCYDHLGRRVFLLPLGYNLVIFIYPKYTIVFNTVCRYVEHICMFPCK